MTRFSVSGDNNVNNTMFCHMLMALPSLGVIARSSGTPNPKPFYYKGQEACFPILFLSKYWNTACFVSHVVCVFVFEKVFRFYKFGFKQEMTMNYLGDPPPILSWGSISQFTIIGKVWYIYYQTWGWVGPLQLL